MSSYNCGNCDSGIEYGVRYCSNCGAEIIWPKEKKVKAKSKKKRKSIKLPINPDHLEKIVSRDSYVNWYVIMMYLFNFLILGLIVSYRQKKIIEWFNSLQTEECDLGTFRRHMASIHRCGVWAITLNVIVILFHILLISNPKLTTYGHQITDQSLAANTFVSLGYIVCGSIGACVGIYICKHSKVLLDELELKKEYIYEFSEKPEVEEEEPEYVADNNNEDKYDNGL